VETGRDKPSLFGLIALPATALGVGAAGWIPLVLSAGLAMGSATDTQIAIPLGLAGIAALIGISLGCMGLVRGRFGGIQAASMLAIGLSGILGIVALVFALSFHW
jgi:hypothetical protein